MKSVSLATSALRGEPESKEGEAKLHGRRFPYVWSSLRRVRSACSGRMGAVEGHSGPPMAPRRMASLDLAAVRAVGVMGMEWALMEHCGLYQQVDGNGTGYREGEEHTPPKRCSWRLNLPALGRSAPIVRMTW